MDIDDKDHRNLIIDNINRNGHKGWRSTWDLDNLPTAPSAPPGPAPAPPVTPPPQRSQTTYSSSGRRREDLSRVQRDARPESSRPQAGKYASGDTYDDYRSTATASTPSTGRTKTTEPPIDLKDDTEPQSKQPIDLTADLSSDDDLSEFETPTKKAVTLTTSAGKKRKRDLSWAEILRIPKTIAAGKKGVAVIALMGEYVVCASLTVGLRCRVFNFNIDGQPLLDWEGGAHNKETYDISAE